jgi:hypothetical protein
MGIANFSCGDYHFQGRFPLCIKRMVFDYHAGPMLALEMGPYQTRPVARAAVAFKTKKAANWGDLNVQFARAIDGAL